MNFDKFLTKNNQFGLDFLNEKGTFIVNHKNRFFPVDSITFLAEHCISNPDTECKHILTVGERQTGKTTGLLCCALEMALKHENYEIAFICTDRNRIKHTSEILCKLVDELEEENNLNITQEILLTKYTFINGSSISFKLPVASNFRGVTLNCLIFDDAELMCDEQDNLWSTLIPALSIRKHVILASMDKKYSRENSIIKHFI